MAPPNARPAARSASAAERAKKSSKGSASGPSARKPPTSQSNSPKKNAKGKTVQKGTEVGGRNKSGQGIAKIPAAPKPGKGKGSGKSDSRSGNSSKAVSNKAKGTKPEVKQSVKSAKPSREHAKGPPAESKAATKTAPTKIPPTKIPPTKITKAMDLPAGPSAAKPSVAKPSAAKIVVPMSSNVLIAPKPKGKKKAEKPPPPRKMHQPVLSTGPALVKSPPPSAISRPGPSMMVGPRPASMMPPPAPVLVARANAAGPNGKPNSPAPPPQQNRPPRLSPFAVTAPIMPVQTKPLKLKMGDKAVHPKHGLGEVIAVEERELGGMKGEFYVLRILDNGMRVMVPVSSPSGLRSVMSPKEADGVLDTMRAREVAVDLQPWSRRFRAYTEMIKSGSPHEVAKVLRDMYRLKFDKDLSFGERRLLDQAKSLLMKELAAAKGVSEVALNEQVAKMFQA